MNDTILPFDVTRPPDPMLIDVDALYHRLLRVPDIRDRRGKKYHAPFF